MKTIADYQPSGIINALVWYAASWHGDSADVTARIAARGALCCAVSYEMSEQEIYVALEDSDAWCDRAICEHRAKEV